jgi:hypothetical protein
MPATCTTLMATLATTCPATNRTQRPGKSGASRRSTATNTGISISSTRWLDPSQVTISQVARGTARVRASTTATMVLNTPCSAISTIQKPAST